jgi:translation initiation factor IF-3
MARRENGLKVLRRLVDELKGKAIAESSPEVMGNRMHQILGPVKTVEKPVRAVRGAAPAAVTE